MRNGHAKSIGFGAATALWWAALVLIIRASYGSDMEPGVWFFAAASVGVALGISGKRRRETGRLAPIFGSLIAAGVVYGTGGWGAFGTVLSVFALVGAGAMIGRASHGFLPGASVGAGLGLIAAPFVIGTVGVGGCLFAGAVFMGLLLPGGSMRHDAGRDANAGEPKVPAAVHEPGSGRIGLLLAGAGVSILAVAWGRIADFTAGGTSPVQFAFHGSIALAFGLGVSISFRQNKHVRFLAGAALIAAAAGAFLLYERHDALPWIYIEQLIDSLEPYQQNWQENLLLAAMVAVPWALLLGAAVGVVRRPVGLRSFFAGIAAGALIAGPVFAGGGVKGSAMFGAQLLLLGGGLFWLRTRGLLWKVAAVATVLAGMLVVFPNAASWRGPLFATAPYRYASVYANQDFATFESEHVTIPAYYEEGRLWTSSVMAYQSGKQLRLDGAIRCDDQWTPSAELLLARIPLLFRTEWESALVLGIGTGIIPGAFGDRGPQTIDVVEPEPSVIAASRSFNEVNAEYWNDERVTVHDEDPRVFILRAKKHYDLIVSSPLAPWDRRTAHMNTREFFEKTAGKLSEGGICAQWLPLSGLPLDAFRTQVRTFAAVFPHVVGFRASNNQGLILIGSAEPLEVLWKHASEVWSEPAIAGRVRALGLGGVPRLISLLRLDSSTIQSFVGDGALNTDWRPRTEWAASSAILDLAGDRFDERLRALHADGADVIDFDGLTDEEVTEVYRLVAWEFRNSSYPSGGYRYARKAYERDKSPENLITYAHFVSEKDRDFDRSIALLKQASAQEPNDLTTLRLLGEEYLVALRYADAEKYASEVIANGHNYYWPYMIRGQARLQMGRPNEALIDLLAARERDRHRDMVGNITYNIAVAHFTLRDYELSADFAQATIGRNPLHRRARLLEAETRTRLGTMTRAEFEREVEAPFNRVRASSLYIAAQGHYFEVDQQQSVEKDLAVIINSTPNHIGAYLLLARHYHDRGNKEKEGEVLSRMIAQFDANKAVMSAFEDYLLRTGGREKYEEFRFIPERLLGSER